MDSGRRLSHPVLAVTTSSRTAFVATLLAVSLLPAGTCVAAGKHSRPYARNAQTRQGRTGLGHAYGPVEVGPRLSADRGPSAR
jgi:hypothetical protein